MPRKKKSKSAKQPEVIWDAFLKNWWMGTFRKYYPSAADDCEAIDRCIKLFDRELINPFRKMTDKRIRNFKMNAEIMLNELSQAKKTKWEDLQ